MPILSRIGRRSIQHRLIVCAIYAVLLAGSVVMVYPLLLMIAGSSKSAVDKSENAIVPGFLTSRQRLYAKYVEGLFNENAELMSQLYGVNAYGFKDLSLPADGESKLVTEWQEFVTSASMPESMFGSGFIATPGSIGSQPTTLRAFKKYLRKRYGNDISQINASLQSDFRGWDDVYLLPSDSRLRQNASDDNLTAEEFRRFLTEQPTGDRYVLTLSSLFQTGFLKARYSGNLEQFNKLHATSFTTWQQIRLTRTAPSDGVKRREWEEFVRYIVHPAWLQVSPEGTEIFVQSLQAKFGSIQNLNQVKKTSYGSYSQIDSPGPDRWRGPLADEWLQFIQGWTDSRGIIHVLPLEMLTLDSPEFRFQDHLVTRYGALASINSTLGTSFVSIAEIQPPQTQWHYREFIASAGSFRWELLTRNFVTVLEYLLINGRGVWNTLVYCALSVGASLLINPLAAYGLSRYRPRSTYALLLLLMLTMAFPPMVTQIPSFLMIRDLHLLNTFAALILPGLANGYSIFLLKGFFDSLPQELYESASLDGAGEFRIFWQITMSLSKPILAVIALNAFMLAYANFMFALLVCQDQQMWTISVWLYHLQSRSGQGVIYASLLLAAIPTLIVFLCCQNVIMRGIVVPVEK